MILTYFATPLSVRDLSWPRGHFDCLENALAVIAMQETELTFFEGQQKVAKMGR